MRARLRRETWMSDQYAMFEEATLPDIPSATSLPAEASGALPCDRQDGETTDPCGREAAPAPASARRAKGEGLMMLVTSGRNGFGSSASAGLQRCLESRLMQRLDTAGSTLWDWTWRAKATPLRRRYFQRQASERRTSATGFSSVPTPNTMDTLPPMDYEKRLNHPSRPGRTQSGNIREVVTLHSQANLSSVPTPTANPANGEPEAFLERKRRAMRNGSQSMGVVLSDLNMVSKLTTVPTPAVGDSLGGGSQTAANRKAAGMTRPSGATYGTVLRHEVMLANLTTPSARAWKDTSGMSESGVDPDGSIRSRLDQLPRQAQLAASGPTATGGSGATASTGQSGKESTPSSGQLNAGYSRWLQGVPVMWDYFTIWATRNLKQRKRGSAA